MLRRIAIAWTTGQQSNHMVCGLFGVSKTVRLHLLSHWDPSLLSVDDSIIGEKFAVHFSNSYHVQMLLELLSLKLGILAVD